MKASELIEALNKEIAIGGDNEVWVMIRMGKDEGGVLRVKASSKVSVNTGFINNHGSDKIVGAVTNVIGEYE